MKFNVRYTYVATQNNSAQKMTHTFEAKLSGNGMPRIGETFAFEDMPGIGTTGSYEIKRVVHCICINGVTETTVILDALESDVDDLDEDNRWVTKQLTPHLEEQGFHLVFD